MNTGNNYLYGKRIYKYLIFAILIIKFFTYYYSFEFDKFFKGKLT